MKKLLILTISVLLIGAGTAFATPITVNSVNHTSNQATVNFTTYSSSDVSVFTEYNLDTTPLGNLDAFCVEGVASGSGLFEIIDVPTDNDGLQKAAWVADQYWNGTWAYNEEDTQVLIWELALGDIFTYKSGAGFANDAAVQTAIANLNIGSPSGRVSLVHHPIGEDELGKQDFLVNVPEPATVLFLGLNILGLGVAVRIRKHRSR